LTLKTRASIELVLDESTLFSGRKFGRQPDGDAEYIDTVETVIQQLHMQAEIRAKEVDEALQEVLSLQTRIEELEEENELLRQRFVETGAEAPEVTAESLLSVKGVGPKTLESLRKHGIHDIKDFLRIKDLGKIANETGIPIARLEKMRKNAEKLSD
jgi:DNA polymerase/3'-5' exonuclease PolX